MVLFYGIGSHDYGGWKVLYMKSGLADQRPKEEPMQ